MRRPNTYGMILRAVICLAAVFLLSGCLRRPLWIYTDEFRQVELITDWSLCDEYPDGMTAWFMSEDLSGQNRRIVTADVYKSSLNLPRGIFTGIVFDWSPAEYGSQEFLYMHRPDSALVRSRFLVNQPKADDNLYGAHALPEGMVIPVNEETGMHMVSAIPEPICADTLKRVEIITGAEGDLIPWNAQEDFQSKLTTQTFYAYPKPILWRMRIYVQLNGYDYMSSVKGTIAGLADGNRLAYLRHTDTPCLYILDGWEGSRNMDNTGSIAITIYTFGLRSSFSQDTKADDVVDVGEDDIYPFRLNLQFLLRDGQTVLNYHYDIAADHVRVYQDQAVCRIEIPIEIGPELPYVDAEGSAGFNADVTPWQDGGSADIDI